MRAPWLMVLALTPAAVLGGCGSTGSEPHPPEQPPPPGPRAPPEPGPDRPAADDATPGHYRELAAFGPRTCGLRTDGRIRCWTIVEGGRVVPAPGVYEHLGREGANVCGIRADGAIGCPPEEPVPPTSQSSNMGVPPGGPFREVTGGDTFRCGLERTGAIRCRGTNALLTPNPPDGRFVSVAAGSMFVCGLTDAGAVQCSTADGPPVQLAGNGFSAIAAGGMAVCGVRRRDGGVECSQPAPGGDTDASGFTQIAIGMSHRCGLSEGHVRCWGLLIDPSHFPPPDETATVVAVGVQTCILREDGTVGCWDTQGSTARMP